MKIIVIVVLGLEMLGGNFEDSSIKHWINFNKGLNLVDERDGFYLTVTIDLKENNVEAFYSGESVGKNICNSSYLSKDLICDDSIPFTIGMMVAGDPANDYYASLKLYGCRFYDRILSDEEIELNYESSKELLMDEN